MKDLNVAFLLILFLLGCRQGSTKNGFNGDSLKSSEIVGFQIKKTFQDSINSFKAAKRSPFSTMQNLSDLVINIDTVFTNPEQNRALCISVISYKFISQENNSRVPELFFDSYGFLGIKKADSSWEIKWADLSSRVKYESDVTASKSLKDFYFLKLNKIEDGANNSLYKYNLGDERFWNSPLWDRYF